MRRELIHEARFRTPELMARIGELSVCVCGAGALGANLSESLARQGFRHLRVIDRDRVEPENLCTQPWQRQDVGTPKARLLANLLFRAVGVEIDAKVKELGAGNAAKLIRGADLVVDCFDNSVARGLVGEAARANGQACLHVGLAADYAEVIWDEIYRVPSASQDDVCDYPLARNLVQLAVASACEVIIGFLRDEARRSYTLTLGDLAIRPYR